ncbi:MAG: hemolysin III family protein, partial [Oscillospiraceae bacterium]|nr:hemolysin III family protein [Oscillospiraceae bacterium]
MRKKSSNEQNNRSNNETGTENLKKGLMYTVGEEIFNSVSHGVGALCSAAALAVLIVYAVIKGNGYSIAGALVYGIALIVLYSMSTVYHIVRTPVAKYVLRIFDHCSIFLLIAGTYTPYTLRMASKGIALGWVIFGLIWGAAVVGIVLNAVNIDKLKKISTACYIFMGWGIILAMKAVIATVDIPGIALLVAGGVVYTVG